MRDLLCNLLMDTLYKYSYNEKYLHLIRVYMRSDSNEQELKNEELIHRLITFIKTHPNPYVMKLIEVDFMIFLDCSVFSILSLFQRLLWLLTTIFDSVSWLMITYS